MFKVFEFLFDIEPFIGRCFDWGFATIFLLWKFVTLNAFDSAKHDFRGTARPKLKELGVIAFLLIFYYWSVTKDL